MIEEQGPWRASRDKLDNSEDSRQSFVESDDFTHDVRLYINGDFATDEQQFEYATEIARRLNEWQAVHNAKVSGAGTASAGLTGYASGDET